MFHYSPYESGRLLFFVFFGLKINNAHIVLHFDVPPTWLYVYHFSFFLFCLLANGEKVKILLENKKWQQQRQKGFGPKHL